MITPAPVESERPITAPEGVGVTVKGWGADEADARSLAEHLMAYVKELSRHIDLAGLDGVTAGGDYAVALAELDRGYESTMVLTPSNDEAIGIAMTPSVLRDGALKSHLVLNANLMAGLLEAGHELHGLALHTLAHECAHVEITAAFDACFPGVLLRTKKDNLLDHCRWEVILACWDEYAATRIAAGIGEDPTDGYEETFVLLAETVRDKADALIAAYRDHGDHGRILCEAYGEYGRLMKYAAYHLGNLAGLETPLADRPKTVAAMDGHWFAPHLEALQIRLAALFDDFGTWEAYAPFEALGDLAEILVAEGGVTVERLPAGQVWIRVP